METPQTLEKRPDPLRDGSLFFSKAPGSAGPSKQGNPQTRLQEGVYRPTPLSAGHNSQSNGFSTSYPFSSGQYVSPSPRAAQFAAFNRSEAARQIRANFESLVRASPNPRAIDRLAIHNEGSLALPWHSAGVQNGASASTPFGVFQSPATNGTAVRSIPHSKPVPDSTPQGQVVRPTPHPGNGGFATPTMRPSSSNAPRPESQPSQLQTGSRPDSLKQPWGAAQRRADAGSTTELLKVGLGLLPGFRDATPGAGGSSQGIAATSSELQTKPATLPPDGVEGQEEMGAQVIPSPRDPRLLSRPAYQSTATPVTSQAGQEIAVKQRAASPPELQPGSPGDLGIAARANHPEEPPSAAAAPLGPGERGGHGDCKSRVPAAERPSPQNQAHSQPSGPSGKQQSGPSSAFRGRQTHEEPPVSQGDQQGGSQPCTGRPAQAPFAANADGPQPSSSDNEQPKRSPRLTGAPESVDRITAVPSAGLGPQGQALAIASPAESAQVSGSFLDALQGLPPTEDRRPEERTFGGRFKRPVGPATLAQSPTPPKHDLRRRRCRSADIDCTPHSLAPVGEASEAARVAAAASPRPAELEGPVKPSAVSSSMTTSSGRRVTRLQMRRQPGGSAQTPAQAPVEPGVSDRIPDEATQPPSSAAADPASTCCEDAASDWVPGEVSDVPDASLPEMEEELIAGEAAEALAALGGDAAALGAELPPRSDHGPSVEDLISAGMAVGSLAKNGADLAGAQQTSASRADSPREPDGLAALELASSPLREAQREIWGGSGRRSVRSSGKKKLSGAESTPRVAPDEMALAEPARLRQRVSDRIRPNVAEPAPVDAPGESVVAEPARCRQRPSRSNKQSGDTAGIAEELVSMSKHGVSSPLATHARKAKARAKAGNEQGKASDAGGLKAALKQQLPIGEESRGADADAKPGGASIAVKGEVPISGTGALQVSRTGRVRAPPMAFWANQRLCTDPASSGGPTIHQDFVDQLALAGGHNPPAVSKVKEQAVAQQATTAPASPGKPGKGTAKASKPLLKRTKGGATKPGTPVKEGAARAAASAGTKNSGSCQAGRPRAGSGNSRDTAPDAAGAMASLAAAAIMAGRVAAAAARAGDGDKGANADGAEGADDKQPASSKSRSRGRPRKEGAQGKQPAPSTGRARGRPPNKAVSGAAAAEEGPSEPAQGADAGAKRPREEDPASSKAWAAQQPTKKQRASKPAVDSKLVSRRCAACTRAKKGYCGTAAAIPGCLKRAAAGLPYAASARARPGGQKQVAKPANGKAGPAPREQQGKAERAAAPANFVAAASRGGADAAGVQKEAGRQKGDAARQNPPAKPPAAAEPSGRRASASRRISCASAEDEEGGEEGDDAAYSSNDEAGEPLEGGWSSEQVRALQAALAVHVDPTAPGFWQKVADCVPGKSASECNAKFFERHPTPQPAKPSRPRRSASGVLPAASNGLSKGVSKKPSVAAARKIAREARWRQRMAAAPADAAASVMVANAAGTDCSNPFVHLIDLQGAKERQARADKYIDTLLRRRGNKRGWGITGTGSYAGGSQGQRAQVRQPAGTGSQVLEDLSGLVDDSDDQEVDEESDKDHYFSDESG